MEFECDVYGEPVSWLSLMRSMRSSTAGNPSRRSAGRTSAGVGVINILEPAGG